MGLRKLGRCQQLENRPPNTFRLEVSFWPRRRQSSNSNACHGPRFHDITFTSGRHLIGSVRTAPISSREVARWHRDAPTLKPHAEKESVAVAAGDVFQRVPA
jgi:hypothetical protein